DTAARSMDAEDDRVAIAAVNLARVLFESARGVELVDRIAALALDRDRPGPVRASAVRAMQTLDAATIAPLLQALAGDPDPEVAAFAQGRGPAPEAAQAQREMLETGPTPDDPVLVRQAIAQSGAALSLPALHQLIERIHEREAGASGVGRAEW